MDHFCYWCFVFVMFSTLFIAALCSPAGKGLTSRLACMCYSHFLMWCSGPGVVLDYIAPRSLPSYFLCTNYINQATDILTF